MAMMYSCRPEPGSAWISWIYAEGRKTTIDGEEGEEGEITGGNEVFGREICMYISSVRVCVSGEVQYVHAYVHTHGGPKWRKINICMVCTSTYVQGEGWVRGFRSAERPWPRGPQCNSWRRPQTCVLCLHVTYPFQPS